MNWWHSVCKILIPINLCENSISGDCGCLRFYAASKSWQSWTLGIPQWSLETRAAVDVWLSPPYWSYRSAVSVWTYLEEAGVQWFLLLNLSWCTAALLEKYRLVIPQGLRYSWVQSTAHKRCHDVLVWAIVPQKAGKGHKLISFISSCVYNGVCALQSACASPRFAVGL